MYTIGEVAKLAKVSVRQLHHYETIGLLVPTARSEAGYRLYSQRDLERLQQILFFRLLELPLADIRRALDAPDFDRRGVLLQQREALRSRARQLGDVLALMDRTIAELDQEKSGMSDTERGNAMKMGNAEMFAAFPELRADYVEEARERWEGTSAWRQSAERARCYTKADWERLKVEMAAVQARLETVFTAGAAPDSKEASDAVEEARLLIERWHYDCSREFHVALTAMTSSDERFVRNIDRNCAGLAAFIHATAKANFALTQRC